MAFDENRARVLRAAGAASAAAPYVRRIMSDDELRNDLRTLVTAGRHLYEGLTENGMSKLLEDDVRNDLDRIVASLQAASERVIRPRRSSRLGRLGGRRHADRRRRRRSADLPRHAPADHACASA